MPHVATRRLTDIFDVTLGAVRTDPGRYLLLPLLTWLPLAGVYGFAIRFGTEAVGHEGATARLFASFVVAWAAAYVGSTLVALGAAVQRARALSFRAWRGELQRRFLSALVANAPTYGAAGASALAVGGFARMMLGVIEAPFEGAWIVVLAGGLVMTAVLIVGLVVVLRNALAVVWVGASQVDGRESWRRSTESMRGRKLQGLVLLVVPLAVTLACGVVVSALWPSSTASLSSANAMWGALVARQGVAALVNGVAAVAWAVMGEVTSRTRPQGS